jgi:NDP-sugar pyrophosphorylase family protein
MKAMIFAAGLGTRLRPLTNTTPKALVEVNGIPLLEIVLTRLQRYGFQDIIINIHHFADRISAFLHAKKNFGLNIHLSHERDHLLDTGGGLKNASWFFDDGAPFLVHNVDILSDIHLQEFYRTHLDTSALATLAVTSRNSTRCLLFDQHNTLCGWKNRQTQQVKMARTTLSEPIPLAFSGIHVISPSIFTMMPEQKIFSIIDVYLRVAATEKIVAFQHHHTLWIDLGKKENLSQASKILRQIHKKEP